MQWIEYKRSYFYEELFKVGTLLKLKDGSVLMVGNVNLALGICDCCEEKDIEYYSNDIVEQVTKLKDDACAILNSPTNTQQ